MTSTEYQKMYSRMYRSRQFETVVVQLWNDGLITGEMHTGIGEEAINAGVVSQLVEGDALALDHRGTGPALMRGVDPESLLLEFLGDPGGLGSGMGGHMHIFSKQHLLASSGIVGASGPAAAGFAMAAVRLRPERIAVAFFGEGALNQGMLMESMNLASTLKLPVIFVCKDNDMAITTPSSSVSSGTPVQRAKGYNIPGEEIDGSDVRKVWDAAEIAISHARQGGGPFLIHAHCHHPQGHFLGDPLLRIAKRPVQEMKDMAGSLVRSALHRKGASPRERYKSLKKVTSLLAQTAKDHFSQRSDPIEISRLYLQEIGVDVHEIEKPVDEEIAITKSDVLKIVQKEV